MDANQGRFPVRTMCQELKASPSGFYAWQELALSQRAMADAIPTEKIWQIRAASDGTYGGPCIDAELRDESIRVGRRWVARPMRRAGLRGVSHRRGLIVMTQSDGKQRPVPDLVNRHFVADGSNRLWVSLFN
jgi:putative transposase